MSVFSFATEVAAIAQQIPEARINWKYGAEAIFFLGIAYGLMRWVGRTLRESASGVSDREAAFMARVLDAGESVAVVPESGTAGSARRSTRSVEGVHCPGCGRPLSAVPRVLPFSVNCSGCGQTVHVRGDGHQRLAVVLERRES